jgi:hypothetical protein
MTTKIVTFKGFWTINDVKKYSDALFVYGDNNVKFGKGGQAIIRELPNTIGIPTKKYPSNNPSSFYSDNDYITNIIRICQAIINIIVLSSKYKYVVLPEDGFGTGFAKLPQVAPKTYKFLLNAIDDLQKII